jgi:radical SAM protein with 4Fe4S-binding SPASM domain
MIEADHKSYTVNVRKESASPSELVPTEEWRRYREIYSRSANGEEFEYPIHLDIENIYACNLHCVHCAREYIEDPGVQRMSDDLYKKVIKEAAAIGTKSLGFAPWGEVFIDKNIFEKIAYARDLGILDIRLHSNGYLVTDAIAEKIVDSGVSWISISLDAATPETYTRVRGGDFKRAVSGLTNLISAKLRKVSSLPHLRVSFVKCSENEHEAELFSRHYSQFCDVAIQEFYDANGMLPKHLQPSESTFSPKSQCFENFYKAFVRYDGRVVPCCEDVRSQIVLGNVAESSLYDVYNSAVAKELRRQHKSAQVENKTCRICMGLDADTREDVAPVKFYGARP